MSNETIINSLERAAGATILNSGEAARAGIPAGTNLADGYTVLESMNTTAGEADLFLCEKGGVKYAAKLYRRETGIKPEVVGALKGLDSPYVARLCYTGEYLGRPLVILPYYKNGSLLGKTFSAETLKSTIIPNINEGLHALHSAGIIHKDLKPLNIMLSDDASHVSIIDFGISSLRTDGRTVLVTSTGMTPEYSAPETFRSLFLEESDYYSFGITLYELLCGHSPYKGLSPEEIARYTSLQRIPFPENMPEELKTLIGALTYSDITSRKNPADPNRRWTYKQVKLWLEGAAQTAPSLAGGLSAYRFCGEKYTDITQLAPALAKNWGEGKKQLFRGLLSGFFKTADPEIAGHCLDAEEAAERTARSDDLIFFGTLYKVCPSLTEIFWKGHDLGSPAELGRGLLAVMRSDNPQGLSLYGDILANGVLSLYFSEKSGDSALIGAVTALEDEYARCGLPEQKISLLYRMGYLLVPKAERCFVHGGAEFADLKALARYLAELYADNPDLFDDFCEDMLDESGSLDPQFEAWLYCTGNHTALEEWKNHNTDIGGTL